MVFTISSPHKMKYTATGSSFSTIATKKPSPIFSTNSVKISRVVQYMVSPEPRNIPAIVRMVKAWKNKRYAAPKSIFCIITAVSLEQLMKFGAIGRNARTAAATIAPSTALTFNNTFDICNASFSFPSPMMFPITIPAPTPKPIKIIPANCCT